MITFNIKSNFAAVRTMEEGAGVPEALRKPRLEKKAHTCSLYFELKIEFWPS